MTLSEQLVILRRRRGLSQAQLAEAVGVSERQISRYENGGAGIMATNTFAALAHVLATTDAEMDALLGTLHRLRAVE